MPVLIVMDPSSFEAVLFKVDPVKLKNKVKFIC